jgi:hypothetical protein
VEVKVFGKTAEKGLCKMCVGIYQARNHDSVFKRDCRDILRESWERFSMSEEG